jgi:hypothetical protein
MAMNSEKDVGPDLTDPEAVDPDAEALQRSQDAIDEGRNAAQEALKGNEPDPDQTEPLESEA